MSQIFISKNNSTTVPLAANATFVGAVDVLTSFEELDINITGSPSNCPGVLYFEFSPEGTNWDVSIPLVYADLISPPIILRTVLPFFRVRYVNGAQDQTIFRLTTVLHKTGAMRLTRFLSQDIDPNEPVEVVRIANTTLGVKELRSTAGTTTSVAAAASNVVLLNSNSNRLGATIFNDSLQILYINLGNTASTSSFTVRVLPNGYYEAPYQFTGVINGIWDVASGNARITEFV